MAFADLLILISTGITFTSFAAYFDVCFCAVSASNELWKVSGGCLSALCNSRWLQLYMARTMTESLISERSGGGRRVLRKEIEAKHVERMANFLRMSYHWPALLSLSGRLTFFFTLLQIFLLAFSQNEQQNACYSFWVQTHFSNPFYCHTEVSGSCSNLHLAGLSPPQFSTLGASCIFTFQWQVLFISFAGWVSPVEWHSEEVRTYPLVLVLDVLLNSYGRLDLSLSRSRVASYALDRLPLREIATHYYLFGWRGLSRTHVLVASLYFAY